MDDTEFLHRARNAYVSVWAKGYGRSAEQAAIAGENKLVEFNEHMSKHDIQVANKAVNDYVMWRNNDGKPFAAEIAGEKFTRKQWEAIQVYVDGRLTEAREQDKQPGLVEVNAQPGTYQKPPVEVKAMQWDGSPEDAGNIIIWVMANNSAASYVPQGAYHVLRTYDEYKVGTFSSNVSGSRSIIRDSAVPFLVVRTLPLGGRVDKGDWVILNEKGEFCTAHSDEFEKTYKKVAD